MRKLSFLVFLIIAVMLFCCGNQSAQNQQEGMKKSEYDPPSSFKDYKDEWNKVAGVEKEGKPRSALEIVERIYSTAQKENNAPQLIKAIIYRTKYVLNIGEKDLPKVIKDFEDETMKAQFPADAVMKSMLAEIYFNYFNRNRYRFYQRTAAAGAETEDIATWSLKTISDKISKLHLEALSRKDDLKKIKIELFDEILVKGTKPRILRPDLYDLLANRAFDHFSSNDTQLTEAANAFEIDSADYFKPASEFIRLDPGKERSESASLIAFRLIKELTAAHISDKSPDALIDIELKRLDFVRSKSVLEDTEKLYLMALEELEKTFSSSPMVSMVTYKKALWYRDTAYSSQTGESIDKDPAKWNLKTSKALCEKVLTENGKGEVASLCREHISSLTQKSLNLNAESSNTPGLPFRMLISYRNVKKLYFKVSSFTPEERKSFMNYSLDMEKGSKILAKKPAVKEWSVDLPDDGDLRDHSVEIKIPALEKGIYGIIAGTAKDFSIGKEAVFFTFTDISHISLISKNDNTATKFYVSERESGKPVENAEITVYKTKYNYSTSRYEEKKVDDLKTDKYGMAVYKKGWFENDYYENLTAVVKKDGSSLAVNFHSGYEQKPRPYERTVFFTDRAIYRPGQTIYFKGIMLEIDKDQKPELLTKKGTTVEFYDVNWQKISSLSLKTNEFGSFQGSFTAPSNVLNGNMTIRNATGAVYVSVEEYKRPKFETKFLPVKESFRLDDAVKIKGTAASYSGAPLTEASVSWRVVRSTYFPYWYWGYNYGYYSGKQTVMGKGKVSTDASGNYEIEFKALPDLSIPKKLLPAFTYTVYADVTDINGETHSTSTYVSVGYTALSLSTDIPEEVNSSEWKKLNIITANLNGEFEAAKGYVKIYRLTEPSRLLRKRLWVAPDRFLMTEKDYIASFPSDLYKNEDDYGTWKQEQPVFSASFDTSKNKILDLNKVSEWKDGQYAIEMDSADKYGTAVKYKKFFKVYKPSEGPFQQNAFSKFVIITPSVEPGGNAKILAGSKAEDVNIVFEIERKNKKTETFFYRINSEKKVFSIPVTESDRGNIGYSLMFQKNGRAYHQSGVIIVPWSDKQLKTEFLSFRDKLYPGQKEEWRIKITGPKANAESAEMVAALYDQSLDSFRPNYWSLWLHPGYYFYNQWLENQSHMAVSSMTYQTEWNRYVSGAYLNYDSIDWFGNYFGGYYGYGYGRGGGGGRYRSMDYDGDVMFEAAAETAIAADEAEEKTVSKKMKAASPAKAEAAGFGGIATGASATRNFDKNTKDRTLSGEDNAQENRNQTPAVQIRKNMSETAFFYPALKTDEKGEIVISFTVPEALTKWKFMGLAHTKDLKTGMITKETVTQKDLMVMPNMPRFLREGDSVTISAKITSMVDKVLRGKAELKLFDAMTMKPVDKILSNNAPFQNFEIKEKGNAVVNWPVKIPLGVSAVTWRIIATAGDQGDGEEATIPVLSNRMLVTESMPLPVKGNEKKEFVFKKLIDSKSSDTLVNHRLTLEFTSNPVWYAVQALPYLMEYPYECAEQIFSRFYANSLASHIANSSPNIKKVFDQWKNTDALLSNLQKNEELKSVLLAETPWVLDAQNEEQNKKRVALLFDLNRMGNELDSALKKLKKIQGYNGGWPWFEGLPESWYITQHIVSGLGKLRNLKVKEAGPAMELAGKGILFIDNEMRKSYDWMKKNGVDMNLKHIGYMEIHYLYTRSFFTDIPVQKQNLEAYNYWISQAKKYWLGETPYMNAMEAAALWRLGEKEIPQKIVDSLKERAIYNDELGMYFKENMGGYYWYQFPIETQAVIIEAFQEVTKDIKTVDDLKTWLLKMKQVQDWKTTKATVDAIYALLMGGSDWLKNNKNAEITLGNIKVDPAKMGAKTEAGTGHFKVAWNSSDIKPEMGKVTVVNPNSNPAWGAVYWQYFEQLDKITPAETPLKLEKKIFKEIQTDSGATLEPVLNNAQLKPGDRLKVRIVLRTDRDMEYIHMKDMRAAGTEPENVISRHKYQDGLWYYESTKDVSTDFFIERLNKGTYVFEYPLRVNLKGNFSAGITTIQCMYAPEFSAHSEGIRVEVK